MARKTEQSSDAGNAFIAAAPRISRHASAWWNQHPKDEPARINLSVRLNTRHLEALRRMTNPETGVSMQRVARSILVPAIEAFIAEAERQAHDETGP